MSRRFCALRSETRRLKRGVSLVVAVIIAGSFVASVFFAQKHGAEEAALWRAGCQPAEASAVVVMDGDTDESLSYISSTQTPLGSLGVSSGLMSTGIGFFALLLVAAVHVAGEWQRKTIKEFYRGKGQALSFVLSKFVSLFLVGLGLVILGWIVLTLWGIVSKHVFPIPLTLSTTETWHWVYPTLIGLPAVLIFYAALGVMLGVLIKDVAGVIVGGGVGFLALGWLSHLEVVAPFSPTQWMMTYMFSEQQTQEGQALLRLLCSDWSPSLPTNPVSGVAAILLLGALGVALLVGSWIVLEKQDVMR